MKWETLDLFVTLGSLWVPTFPSRQVTSAARHGFWWRIPNWAWTRSEGDYSESVPRAASQDEPALTGVAEMEMGVQG